MEMMHIFCTEGPALRVSHYFLFTDVWLTFPKSHKLFAKISITCVKLYFIDLYIKKCVLNVLVEIGKIFRNCPFIQLYLKIFYNAEYTQTY